MSTKYIVFLGAPSPSSTLDDSDEEISYQWRTITSTTIDPLAASQSQEETSADSDLFAGFPSSALDAASRRISALTESVMFVDEDEDADEDEDGGDTQSVEDHLITDSDGRDQTSLITWSTSQPSTRVPLRASTISESPSLWQQQPQQHNNDNTNPETQFTTITTTTSSASYYDHSSSTSSIGRFPAFHFSLSTLSELASARGKTCLLLAVLEVDGPDEVTVRRGPDAGKAVSVLRLIVGDEASTIRRLTAWRDVAEAWGGGATPERMRCGDVVYFENVLVQTPPPLVGDSRGPTSDTNANVPGITASPNLHSRAEICYRTMPRASTSSSPTAAAAGDMQLRPDLRLGASDAAVRRVAAVVSWFERMAGLSLSHGHLSSAPRKNVN